MQKNLVIRFPSMLFPSRIWSKYMFDYLFKIIKKNNDEMHTIATIRIYQASSTYMVLL